MAAAVDFKPVHLKQADERMARRDMRHMLGPQWWRMRGRAAWAGFAAEHALCRAVNALPGPMWCRPAPIRDYDLAVGQGVESLKAFDAGRQCSAAKVEVKTRATSSGWVHPEMFDYITVPMHADEHGIREPIKEVSQLVWFCWYSMDDPRTLWVLGYCRGLDEFKRRSVWYAEGDPLPRGGWAGAGGAYVIEVKQLRPLPEGLLKELDK